MKNSELNRSFVYLSSTTGNGLTVDELKKLRKARKEIKGKLDEYVEVRKSIWESYGIKVDKDLEGRTDRQEILDKISQLDNEEIKIEGLNFLSEETVITCSPTKFNQADLDKMIELLGK